MNATKPAFHEFNYRLSEEVELAIISGVNALAIRLAQEVTYVSQISLAQALIESSDALQKLQSWNLPSRAAVQTF